jgi:hypothetical protein
MVASNMNEVTPEEARAALVTAGNQALGVRRTDKQYRPILLGIAAMYLGCALLVSLFPHGGSRFAGIALVVIFLGGLAGTLLLLLRIRAYSRRGILWFSWSAFGFTFWNAAVVGVSSASGWWGPHQPGIHFFGSAIIGVLPLLVAGWLVGRWR